MRKVLLAALIVITLFASCTKEKQTTVKKMPEVILFRAEGVSINGTIQYSDIATVTIN